MSNPSLQWLQALAGTETNLPSTEANTAGYHVPSISRVAQLDANLLDNELENILKDPLWKALDGVKGSLKRRFEPEMLAIMRFSVLYSSVYQAGASYGSQLQNLKYTSDKTILNAESLFQSISRRIPPSKVQRFLYVFLSVFIPYISTRTKDYMLSVGWSEYPLPESYVDLLNPLNYKHDGRSRKNNLAWRKREWKRLAWEIAKRMENFAEVLTLLNYLVFLVYGRYRSVLDRVLGMKLDFAHKSFGRGVSFEFLNRQLIWEAVTDFILFLMPLINPRKLRSKLLHIISSVESLLSHNPTPSTERPTRGPLHYLPPTTCPICFSRSAAPPSSLPRTGSVNADPSDPAAAIANLASLSSLPNSGLMDSEEVRVKTPYTGECGCKYCYYCIAGALARWQDKGKKSGWECLRCGKEIKKIKRWDKKEDERKRKEEEKRKKELEKQRTAGVKPKNIGSKLFHKIKPEAFKS